VVWKGTFPPTIKNILQNMPGHKRDMLLDGATSIWRARCKEVHDTTNLEEDPKAIAKRERVYKRYGKILMLMTRGNVRNQKQRS
jgi:hypothetical protein